MKNSFSNHLLHLLFEEQKKAGFISDDAMREISKVLNLPRAQVESVVEFYHFFHRQARGIFDIQFSNCTSCGDVRLMQRLCNRLNLELGHTRADGRVSIDQTSCIGMCDHGVSLLLNNHLVITALSNTRIDKLAELIEANIALEKWPKQWFAIDDNIHKKGLLLAELFESGSALKAALGCSREAIIEQVMASGLRGRGGAGFPAGLKWKLCRETVAETRYVICNADEGEPGTFKDRVLLNRYADRVFEGMTISGYAIAAKQGVLYLRGEYRYLLDELNATLQKRRDAGLLGQRILEQDFDFDIAIVVGAGAYICGEESALLESLEERRGIPRIRPPFPVTQGYLGQPTIVNNVETLVAVVNIILNGHREFKNSGTEQSRGSKLLSVSGDCRRAGIYEYDFGVTVQQVLDDAGATNVQAVQIGGPAGRLIASSAFKHKIAFEDIATGGSFMIFNQQRNVLDVVRNFSHFFAHESCGFCTPCRVGTRLLKNGMDKLCDSHTTARDINELKQLASLVTKYSHCGLGLSAANPILDGLKYFPACFEQKILSNEMEPEFDVDLALTEAREIAHKN